MADLHVNTAAELEEAATRRERTKQAFDLASASIKQLITLATGVTALTATFAKDVLPASNASSVRGYLVGAWIVYVFSILFGVWGHLALTGEITNTNRDPSVYGANVVTPVVLQIATFIAATGLIIFTAVKGIL